MLKINIYIDFEKKKESMRKFIEDSYKKERIDALLSSVYGNVEFKNKGNTTFSEKNSYIKEKIEQMKSRLEELKNDITENRFRKIELEARKLSPMVDKMDLVTEDDENLASEFIDDINNCSRLIREKLISVIKGWVIKNEKFIEKKYLKKYFELTSKANSKIAELDDCRCEIVELFSEI